METWDTYTTVQREHVPEWLVDIAQLWTSQSATTSQYQEEYKQIRRLAKAAQVPPFVIIVRMFRDTYQVSDTTTQEQFQKRMDDQLKADGGQLFMRLAAIPSEEAQRVAYVKELEENVAKAAEVMHEAVKTDDDTTFRQAAATSGRSQEMWLIVAQNMTPEQARATMIDFAQQEVTQWMEERRPGPPPSIFIRYQ